MVPLYLVEGGGGVLTFLFKKNTVEWIFRPLSPHHMKFPINQDKNDPSKKQR